MIKELAKDSIVALGIVPDKDVRIDQTRPDWDGKPQIYVTSEPTKADEQAQMGAVSMETVMGIHCLAQTREKAWELARSAVGAVYEKFTELEQTRGSGILCITYIEHNVFQHQERSDCYIAFFSFRVLTTTLNP
jgi:hypothetical protein